MPFGSSLRDALGPEPGWLRRVPAATVFDFVAGKVAGPGISLARLPGSGRWIPTAPLTAAFAP